MLIIHINLYTNSARDHCPPKSLVFQAYMSRGMTCIAYLAAINHTYI